MNDKTELRRTLRQERKALVAAQPAAISALLFLRPPAPVLDLLPEGATIGLYSSVGAEAPALRWARWLFENGRHLALPWFGARGSEMVMRRWANPFDESLLAPDPFGARQPQNDAEEVVPDALVVPLLGFTADCDRIGQGAGHYDRWLAAHPATRTVGLAWDCQLREQLPIEPHDRPLDAVVTPTRFYRRTA